MELKTVWPKRRIAILAIVFLPAFILFGMNATTDIRLPGIYMDAVNPDYLVVRLLHPHHAQIADWHVPGTLLFGRLPVIGQIYHGALPFYVGLPFYALFGTGVVGIRLTNMIFGLLVLSGTGAFMLAFRARPLICALCLALLALDPGFIFSFRTQFYITLLPVAALLASAALIEAYSRAPTHRCAIISGLLAGVACYGYFIYGFLVPPVALFALYRWGWSAGGRRLIRWWACGLLLAMLPYVAGWLLILRVTGPHGFMTMLRGDIQPGGAPLSAWAGLLYFIDLVHYTILDIGPPAMMVKKTFALDLPGFKAALLLALPCAAIATGLVRPSRVSGLLLLGGMIVGFLVLVIIFRGKLWLHHAALLLPLLYAALALALERFASLAPTRHARLAGWVAILVAAPLLIGNTSDTHAVFQQLQATRGVDLSSDAIDRYAEDSLTQSPLAYRFFPDWGVFMSFVMITRGGIPYSTGFVPSEARNLLCAGQDVELVALADQPKQRLQDWIQAVGWGRHEMAQYEQGSGTPSLDIVRWRAADRPPGACE